MQTCLKPSFIMIKSQRLTPLVTERCPVVLTCIGGEPIAHLICAVLKHIPVEFMV